MLSSNCVLEFFHFIRLSKAKGLRLYSYVVHSTVSLMMRWRVFQCPHRRLVRCFTGGLHGQISII